MLTFNKLSGELSDRTNKSVRLNKNESAIFLFMVQKINIFSSKEELISIGWADKFVSPNSLTVAIKNIRKALSATGNILEIETLHRRGYILHGDITNISIHNDDNSISVGLSISSSPTELTSGKEKATERIEQSTPNHTKKISYHRPHIQGVSKAGKLIIKLATTISILIICTLAFIIYTNTGDVYCYQLAPNTRACGVFPLSEKNNEKLKMALSGQVGEFFYGYKNHTFDFKLYNAN